MDANAVLEIARSDAQLPSGWYVWPLRRDLVFRAMLGWALTSLIGFIVLIPTLFVTIPGNFESGTVGSVLTTIVLLLLAAVAFGGLGIAIYDGWRYFNAEKFLLIMTPDDFIKAEPHKVIHVPMEHVSNVTLRGIKIPYEAATESATAIRTGGFGRVMGGQMLARQPKSPPSLAFLDARTQRQVTVGTDESFDALIALDQILSMQVDAKQRQLSRGRF